MFMDYNELKILFQKYQEGKITREEFYLLQKQVNMHSDKTLQPIFEKQWEQFEEYIPLSSDKKCYILASFHPEICQREDIIVIGGYGLQLQF